MIVAHRMPDLTDQMLRATLRAGDDLARSADDVMRIVEAEHLERRLQACLAPLGYEVRIERRAA